MSDQENIKKLTAELALKDQKISELEAALFILKEQFQQLLRGQFGQKREKLPPDFSDLPLFAPEDLALTLNPKVDDLMAEQTVSAPAKTRKPQEYGKFMAGLPEEIEVVDLPEAEKVGLVFAGEDVTKRLACKPAQYFVKVTIIKKYTVPNRPEYGIISMDLPKEPIIGSLFDSSFYARLLVMKYSDHLPLYRIEEILKREGIHLSRQTMSQMVLNLGKRLKPLVEQLKKRILESQNCHLDETTVKEMAKDKCKTGYFWTMVGTMYDPTKPGSSPPMVYYQYIPNRKSENVTNILGKDFKGKIHSDAYEAYDKLSNNADIIWQPCWVHARRNFFNSQSADPLREDIIKLIDKLFEYEREFWAIGQNAELTANEQRSQMKAIRAEKCAPLANQIFTKVEIFLTTGHYIRGEKILLACNYLVSRKKHFLNFLDHLDLRIDNNVCERSIRPLTIGRKNWLFVGSEDGGEAAAVISSLIQTCRNFGINPEKYLENTLRQISSVAPSELVTLLP